MIKADMKRIVLLLLTAFCLTASQMYGQSEAENQYRLGYNYFYGEENCEKNLTKAFTHLKKAAEAGYSKAYNYVGMMFEKGEGTSKNLSEAFKWYERSAIVGDRLGQHNLAECYLKGNGVAQNNEKALEWFSKSAEQGFMRAYTRMGNILEKSNPEEAFKYYEKAAKGGEAAGQYNLAMCYVDAIGTASNDEEARKWCKKSANQGYQNAIRQLEEMDNPSFKLFPLIDFIDYDKEVSQSSYSLDIGIKADNGRITKRAVYLNGSLSRSITVENEDGYDVRWKQPLTLLEGKNTIRVEATNRAGTSQKEVTITYRPMQKASVEWLSLTPTVYDEEFPLNINVSSDSNIEAVEITVNGKQGPTVTSHANNQSISKVLALTEGNNIIKVSVTNAAGTTTAENYVKYIKLEKRLALIIGNSNYHKSGFYLPNPVNDASDLAAKLKELHFEVILKTDTDLKAMRESVNTFGAKAKDFDVALFYYAGHAIQSKGDNYLIPVDANLASETDLTYYCENVNRVIGKMDESKKCMTKMVFLDACRNNPFERSWSRGIAQGGLSQITAPSGYVIAYATDPGKTASDGKGRNSPYTEAILHTLNIENLGLMDFFDRVGLYVIDKTENKQTPWMSKSYYGKFVFNQK